MWKVNRRDFIKTLSLGGAGAVLLGGIISIPSRIAGAVVFGLGRIKHRGAKTVSSICPFCDCGCGLLVHSKNDKVVGVEGDPEHPINEGTLCSKGLSVSDLNAIITRDGQRVQNRNRITRVMYRAPGSSKWEVKEWGWALSRIADRLKTTRDQTFVERDKNKVTVNHARGIAFLGSSSLGNEESYLLQKLMRSLGVINIDHDGRFSCSVNLAGIAENALGRNSMTNHLIDYKNSDVVLVVGANLSDNHPLAMKWILRAKEERGAKIIVVDPRFTRTAAEADIYAPIRPGTDLAFIYGMINYAIERGLYNREYLVDYTNASYLISPDFYFKDGIFSGEEVTVAGHVYNRKNWPEEKMESFSFNSIFAGCVSFSYDNKSWQYRRSGGRILKDESLNDPSCVFQILKKHASRYDIKTVCRVTGTPEDVYRKVCEAFCGGSGRSDKAGNLIYGMGVTQHISGTQNVRAIAILQLLLGNVGISGGGVNGVHWESNGQGAYDMGMVSNLLTGYVSLPRASKHPTSKKFFEEESLAQNNPEILTSLLKAWYGDKAVAENEYCYHYLPKLDDKEYSHMDIFDKNKEIKGMIVWGQNLAVGGPASSFEMKQLENLKWLVVVDQFETETAAFWKRPGTTPRYVETEVFLLPGAAFFEKNGTLTNSGRWVQYREKAVDPPGEAKCDLWIINRLYQEIKKAYQAGGKFTEPIMNLVWNYGDDGEGKPEIEKIAREISGFSIKDGKALSSVSQLRGDGSTACGCWLYCGYWPAAKRRRLKDDSGLGLYPEWSFSWPGNTRIIYNRCSCDAKGRPYNEDRALLRWNETLWEFIDIPDFKHMDVTTGKWVTPGNVEDIPFSSLKDGRALIFAPDCKEGPLPEYYEPVESPVRNILSNQQFSPMIIKRKSTGDLAETKRTNFPHIGVVCRFAEHHLSGSLTRNLPFLVELMPEMFVEISTVLAEKIGVKPGDKVEVVSTRGSVTCKVRVTASLQTLNIEGKRMEIVAMPWQWGFQGLAKGASANVLVPFLDDPIAHMPEFKAFACEVRKVSSSNSQVQGGV